MDEQTTKRKNLTPDERQDLSFSLQVIRHLFTSLQMHDAYPDTTIRLKARRAAVEQVIQKVKE